MWLNDDLAGEIALNAAVCGAYGVPVIAISGDQSACAEAAALISGIHTAQVKKANGRMNAECLPLSEAHEIITSTVTKAVKNYKKINPYLPASPTTIRVEFFQSDMADWAEGLPGSKRVSARMVEYTSPDVITASKAFRTMVRLASI